MTEIQRSNAIPILSGTVVHGETVYLSGKVGLESPGNDLAAQTKEIFGIIDKELAEVGSDKSKLLRADIWLKDIGQIAEFNDLWLAWLDGCEKPVRAAVQADLVKPEWVVEVAVIATK